MDYVCENIQITEEKTTDRNAILAAYGKVYDTKKTEISENTSKEVAKDA